MKLITTPSPSILRYKLLDHTLLNHIIDILVKQLNSNHDLEQLHKVIPASGLNKFRTSVFSIINRLPNLKYLLYLATYDHLKYVVGPDLAVQTSANVSIQCPYDTSSILNKHKDSRSGDSPFQYVIWIPITRAFDSNAMHMLNDDTKEFRPISAEPGEFLLFDPKVEHGNILNETASTRISINIRVKNWFTPDSNYSPDRQFGLFYEDFVLSESTLRAIELHKLLSKQ